MSHVAIPESFKSLLCSFRLIYNPLNGRPPYNPITLVVDTGCSHVGVVRKVGRFFERSTGFEESRNSGCSADMISNPVGEPCIFRTALKTTRVHTRRAAPAGSTRPLHFHLPVDSRTVERAGRVSRAGFRDRASSHLHRPLLPPGPVYPGAVP